MAKKEFTLFDFMERFPDERSCISFLSSQKWRTGFTCLKCCSTKSKQGKKASNRRCSSCGYEESPTANTLFHKLKFPLHKAFHICYQLSVNKKGMSTLELSRQYGLSQKTCWFFKRKVQKAMQSSNLYPLAGVVEIDEFSIGGHEKNKPGRSDGKKRKVILGVEVVLNKKNRLTIGRAYSKVIDDYSTESFKPFFYEKIRKDATIFTDLWSSYKPLAKQYDINQEKSNKGESMKLLHTHIMNLKSWIRGIHHHISSKHAQCYMDEYHFKFNRRLNLESCFYKTIESMVQNGWFSYKNAIQTN